MSRTNTRRRRRRLPKWALPALVGGGLLLAGVLWLLPRRVDDVVTAQGDARWSREQAPPRRQIIWQPAENIPAPVLDEDLADGETIELANPQWADGGLTLYYTVRRDGASADIYRSSRQGEGWSPGEPVDALNTPADDFGPRLSADGKTLYLYSNRPGGVGGFDLYVSRRTGDGWSVPVNLGESVNTPANEYAPAVSPDGSRLFFASNRTRRMQDRTDAERDSAQWSATLRAETGLRQYDLYVAQRDDEEHWAAPAPLKSVNLPTSNEGEPLVSPDGAFLYFTSDRANARGKSVNYDVYRARLLGDAVGRVENLGAGVNTAGDEHEPALSDEGFRLIYSSNHPRISPKGDDEQRSTGLPAFALYESRAVEVFNETAWDTSHATGLLAYWWLLVLALLLAALAAAIVWYIRQVSLKRATVPGFLLLALMLHLLLAGISFLLHERHVIYALTHEGDNVVADDSLRDTARSRNEPRFDQLADLASVATARPQAAPRQAAPRASATLPPVRPAPNKPAPLRPEQPAPRVATFTPPAPPVTEPEMSRRPATVEELAAAEPIKMLPAEPAAAQAKPSNTAKPPAVNVNVDRQPTPPRDAVANAAASRPSPKANASTPFEVRSARPQGMAVPASAANSARSPLVREQGLTAEVEALAKIEIDVTAGGAPSPAPDDSEFVSPPGKVHIDREAAPPRSNALAAAGAARPHPIAGEQALSPTDLAGAPNLAEVTAAPSSPGSVTLNRARFSPAKADALFGKIQLAEAGVPAPDAAATDDGAPAGAIVHVDRQTSPDAGSAADIEASARFNASGKPAPDADPLVRADAAPTAPDAFAGTLADIFGRRANQTQTGAEFGEVQLADATAAGDAPTPSNTANDDLAGVAINAQRQAAPGDAVALALESFDNTAKPGPRGIEPGELAAVRFDLRPRIGPLDSPFSRREAPNLLLKFAQGNIGLQSMFRLRVGDDAMKKDLIDAFGGDDDATLAAIRRGLAFLAKAQLEEGHWDFRKFRHTGDHRQGNTDSLTAATGLGLLPFLGDGHTHLEGQYKKTVDGGLKWLVEHQKENGDLFTGGEGNARMYSHAIAAIALCEAFGLSRDEALKDPAQASINFIVAAQHSDGGWRYQPNQAGDMSVFGWQIMALKSAQMAGLEVPQKTLDSAKRYLEKAGVKNHPGEFGYQPGGGGKPAMTAEGLLCMEYLGAKKSDPNLQAGVQYLMARPPAKGQDDSYYWYYGTQTLFHYQGEAWTAWNEGMGPTLLATQQTRGDMAGAWPKRDHWEHQAGPLYATSLRLLMLEVYVRHVPLYQLEE